MLEKIWEFKTENFTVLVTAEEEYDIDLSWDETGEVAEKINSQDLVVFCAKSCVIWQGAEIGTDHLGQCIYEDFSDFRNESYFRDMVRDCIIQARHTIRNIEKPYIRESA